MAQVAIPASMAIYQGFKVVQYVHENVEKHGLLVADGDFTVDLMTPLAKLEVVQARSGNGRVHIRSSYNNKFWAIRREGDDSVVAPVADEPVEDESAWGCTMFLPSTVPQGFMPPLVQFLHVQRGRLLFIDQQTSVLGVAPAGASTPPAHHMRFSFADLAPLFVMPRYVAFKDVDNGNYLRFATINRQPFLQFSSAGGVDKFHPSVVHEIFLRDIVINTHRIKCHSSNVNHGFWRRDSKSDHHWVLADSTEFPSNSPVGHYWGDSVFTPVKVAERGEGIIVALRNGEFDSNTKYLAQRTASNVQNGASVHATSINSPGVRLVMEEVVRSRLIYNVNFNRLDTRIYSNPPQEVTSQQFNNITSVPQNMELTFTYSISKTGTWNATVSVTVGVSTTFKTGIPFIANGEISTSVEATTAYEWGRSYTETETREDKANITVPSMSRVTVTRIETQGTCDIPFSYSQEDTLFNWERVVTEKHDGLYKGVNSFNINYLAREEPLPGSTTQETKTYPVVPHTSRVI